MEVNRIHHQIFSVLFKDICNEKPFGPVHILSEIAEILAATLWGPVNSD